MSLDIGRALREGATRTATLSGAILVGAFLLTGALNLVLVQSFQLELYEWVARQDPAAAGQQPATPLAAPLPLAVSGVGVLVHFFLVEAVRIVGIRVMAGDHTGAIPGKLVTRNLPLAVLNGAIGAVVVGVLVGLGSLLLLVPGIFLAIAFFFVRQEIAIEDENFVEAMVNSWELGEGNRIELAVLALAVFAVGLVVLVPYLAVFLALGQESPVPYLLQTVLQAPVFVFGVAVATRAYVQLTGAGGGAATDEGTASDGRTDDDEEEWPDPPGVDI